MNDLERALGEQAEVAAPLEAFLARAEREGLVEVAYTTYDSPFGPLLLAATRRGLVRIAFPEEETGRVLAYLAAQVSPRLLELPARLDPVRRQLDQYFSARRRRFELPVDWRLTAGFGRRVLRATSRIPYGQVASYREVATAAGSPRAARAAGNALASNPIPVVVPCHRVVHTGGELGGYAGGPSRKEFLLALEEAGSS